MDMLSAECIGPLRNSFRARQKREEINDVTNTEVRALGTPGSQFFFHSDSSHVHDASVLSTDAN